MTYLNWRNILKRFPSNSQFTIIILTSKISKFLRLVAAIVIVCSPLLLFAEERDKTEFQIISEGSLKGLVDASGNVVIPVIYENLGWSNGSEEVIGEVIGYFEKGGWGLINTKNAIITEASYTNLHPLNDIYLVAARKAAYSNKILYGLLDEEGAAILGFQYSSLSLAGENIKVSQSKKGRLKFGVLSFKERVVIPIEYEKVEWCGKGYVVQKDGSQALFDFSGQQLTTFKYYSMADFNDHLLVSDHFGRQGVVDPAGREIVQTVYKSVTALNDSSVTLSAFPTWELILPSGSKVKQFSYDNVIPVNHGIFRVTANGWQTLINTEEEFLLKGSDWNMYVPDEEFVLISKNGKHGVLREGGIEVLPLTYDSIYYSGRHFYAMILKNGIEKWQIFSTYGNLTSSNSFEAIFPMSENLIANKKNGYWGYMDFSGHTVVEYKYDYAWPFKEGKAKVNYLGNQGIINTTGDWVVKPDQGEVTIISANLFIKHLKDKFEIVGPGGKITYFTRNKLEAHPFGVLEITEDGRYGLIDQFGESFLSPIYDEIVDASFGFFTVKKGDKYGVVDDQGKHILPLTNEYQAIESFSEGFLKVKRNNRYGFVDLDGKLRISNRYDEAEDFKNGVAAIKLLGSWGFIDKIDRIAVQPQYDIVSDFVDGICTVRKGGAYGIIDAKGNEILSVEFDSLSRNRFNSIVIKKSGRYGLADGKGELLVPAKYDELEENENGLLIIKKRGSYGVIDKKGINIIPSIYSDILYDGINGYYLAAKESEKTTQLLR